MAASALIQPIYPSYVDAIQASISLPAQQQLLLVATVELVDLAESFDNLLAAIPSASSPTSAGALQTVADNAAILGWFESGSMQIASINALINSADTYNL